MKLKHVKIAGFRGFNTERTIQFDDQLTLIAAPNSHGKTSISEALEFLLTGVTSKVEHADSKDEYQDSYRNRHLPPDQRAFVEAVLVKTPTADELTLRIELDAAGNIQRYANGVSVPAWDFTEAMKISAQPFILQHALKYLLLVAPVDRFQGFARLLGLNEVDTIKQAIVNLCTKPAANLSHEASRALTDLDVMETRIAGFKELGKIQKHFNKSPPDVEGGYVVLQSRTGHFIKKDTPVDHQLAGLIAARDAANAKVYSGTIQLQGFSASEHNEIIEAVAIMSSTVNAALVAEFGTLSAGSAMERLREEAHLLQLGTKLIQTAPASCPLCGQALGQAQHEHISRRKVALEVELNKFTTSEDPRVRIQNAFRALKTGL